MLQSAYAKDVVELRLYNFPHFARIVITDRCIFVMRYSSSQLSRETIVTKHLRDGETYKLFNRLFDLIWEDSKPPKTNETKLGG